MKLTNQTVNNVILLIYLDYFYFYLFIHTEFLVKELKKFEFKSLIHNQYNSSVNYEVFPIDIPKFTQKSQCQFDEPNKQTS